MAHGPLRPKELGLDTDFVIPRNKLSHIATKVAPYPIVDCALVVSGEPLVSNLDSTAASAGGVLAR